MRFLSNCLTYFHTDRLSRDIIWNIASLVVLGVCGLIVNFTIGKIYGPEILGVFNQVYVVLVICSQFCSFGLYFSSINFISENHQNSYTCSEILIAALIITIVISFFVITFIFTNRNIILWYFKSKDVEIGTLLALPAAFFSGIDRILLATINGLLHMRAYAIFNSLRYFLILIGVLLLVVFEFPSYSLPIAFSIAECLLFLFLAGYFVMLTDLKISRLSMRWVLEHLKFATKAFPSGFLLDVNLRIDLLVLGYLLPDRSVGLYSLIAMIAEGIVQLPYVILFNINPIIVKYRIKKEYSKISDLVKKINKMSIPALFCISFLCLIFYIVVINLFHMNQFYQSWQFLAVILVGISLSSGYIPFGMILNQFGYPGWQTIYLVSVVLVNLFFNILLIPIYGNMGAATSTAFSYIASIFLLKFFVRMIIRKRII